MELSITHFDDRELYCKTSEVIQPNSVMKISGEGMTNTGNMFIKFNVVFPSNLSEERKMYIKKLIDLPTTQDNQIKTDENPSKHFKFLDTISKKENDNVDSATVDSKNHSYRQETSTDDEGVPQCATQ